MQEYLHNQRGVITALERQDLSRTYLAHHELESDFIIYHHDYYYYGHVQA